MITRVVHLVKRYYHRIVLWFLSLCQTMHHWNINWMDECMFELMNDATEMPNDYLRP